MVSFLIKRKNNIEFSLLALLFFILHSFLSISFIIESHIDFYVSFSSRALYFKVLTRYFIYVFRGGNEKNINRHIFPEVFSQFKWIIYDIDN